MTNPNGKNNPEGSSLGVKRFLIALIFILAIAFVMLLFIRYTVL